MKSLVAKQTAHQLEGVVNGSAGSYLFWGPAGVGKYTVARELASQLAGPSNLLILENDGTSIGIAEIQEICYQLTLKSLDAGKRVLIVRDAEKMTPEAQNAFLKTLEEPAAEASIILVAEERAGLLPTILSRCQVISFVPLTEPELGKWLGRKAPSGIVKAAGGLPGLAKRLMEDVEYQATQIQLATLANALTAEDSTFYERLAAINGLSDKLEAMDVVTAVAQAASNNLRTDKTRTAYMVRLLGVCSRLGAYLVANGNSRLALNELALEASR